MLRYRFVALIGIISLTLLLASCQHEPGTIIGRVLDHLTNQPIANATVTLGDQAAQTNAAGAFQIADVKSGTYTVTAQAPDYESATAQVVVKARQTAVVELKLAPLKVSATVNPQGGTVLSFKQARLEIPPQAVTQETTITIKQVANPPSPPNGVSFVSPVYEITLGPGTELLSAPAKLILPLSLEALENRDEKTLLTVAYWDGANWAPLGGEVDEQNKTITVEVGHFSLFSVLRRVLPSPPITTKHFRIIPLELPKGYTLSELKERLEAAWEMVIDKLKYDIPIPIQQGKRINVWVMPLKKKAGQVAFCKLPESMPQRVRKWAEQHCVRLFEHWFAYIDYHIYIDPVLGELAAKTAPAHEFFHIVQINSYLHPRQKDELKPVLWWMEATATWIGAKALKEEEYLEHLSWYAGAQHPFLAQSLDYVKVDYSDYQRYRAGVFVRYLEEKYGADVIKEIWKRLSLPSLRSSPHQVLQTIDEVLRKVGTSLSEVYFDFAIQYAYARELEWLRRTMDLKRSQLEPDAKEIEVSSVRSEKLIRKDHLSSEVFRFVPAPGTQGTLKLGFDWGGTPQIWRVRLFIEKPDGSASSADVAAHMLDYEVPGFGTDVEGVVVVAVNWSLSQDDAILNISYTYSTTPTTRPTTYFISGQVTVDGRGLDGVTVTLSGAKSATTTTDGNGNYSFSGLPNGTYTITPNKQGYTFSPSNRSITISGNNVSGQDFTATIADESLQGCTVTLSPGDSIQEAINRVQPRAVICLAAGTWEESPIITKSLTLRGASVKYWGIDSNTSMIKGSINITNDSEIQVTIIGLFVGGAVGGKAKVVFQYSSGGIITKDQAQVTVQNSMMSTIEAAGSAQVIIQDSIVCCSGIFVGDQARLSLTNSQVAAHSSSISSLEVEDSAQVNIINSLIGNSEGAGIVVTDSARVSLVNSRLLGSGIALIMGDSARAEVQGSTIEDNGIGILVNGGIQLVLRDSVIRNNAGWGVAVGSVEDVEKCDFNWDDFTGKVIFEGNNVIEGNNKAGKYQGEMCLPPAGSSQEQESAACTVTVRPGQSIQKAIDRAARDAVICLATGTFIESLRIEKSLTLRGAGQEKTLIGGAQEYWVPIITIEKMEPPITVQIEGLKIARMCGDRLCEGGSGRYGSGYGVLSWGHVTISNSTFSNNWIGIDIRSSAKATISNSTISENGVGISVRDSAQATISNSTISGNRIFGISLQGSAQATISGTTISGSTIPSNISRDERTGILVYMDAQATISNSTISENANYGILLKLSAQATISGTTISGNRIGISLENQTKATISNSTISGNKEYGVWLWFLPKATISNSIISRNEKTGIGLDGLWHYGVQRDWLKLTLQNSTVQGNGTDPDCKKPDLMCNGIEMQGGEHLNLENVQIQGNADWGLTFYLEQCGYHHVFYGHRVVFQKMTLKDISANNTSGNLKGKGNPGNHPWNRPGVPDGQVCLPSVVP